MMEPQDSPPDREPAIRMITMPADVNPSASTPGGYIRSLVDIAGGAGRFGYMILRKLFANAMIAIACCLTAGAASAGEAIVEKVRIAEVDAGTYRFDVTVRHADAGWKHYADKWDVVAPGGKILSTRVLLHPHELAQPFTRSLSGVRIPRGIGRVTVRAHDKIHGHGAGVITVEVPRRGQGS
jgi:hypothetical protein